MEIKISNCNSIDEAILTVEVGFLNIKFGVNGTGKSTIAKAIELNATNPDNLMQLIPFKYLDDNNTENIPTVVGAESISTVAVFNEAYVDTFVFKPDELIQNSFEIFIKSTDFSEKSAEIEEIVSVIKNTFQQNVSLDEIINDLTELSGCFGKSKTGYSAAGSIGKGLGKGNKIENVPEGLESYTDYLKCENNTQWIKWQINGNDFIDVSDTCPYCTSPTNEKKDEIKRISNEYDVKSIEHLVKVLNVVEKLEKYFSDDAKINIISITKNKTGLEKAEITYLKQVKEQIDILRDKFLNLKGITFFTFENIDKVIDGINGLKINMGLMPFLNSQETNTHINLLNTSIDTVLQQAGLLQGKVNVQKKSIKITIESYKLEINDFLKYAGYQYSVEIEGNSENYKMRLRHNDMSKSVNSGDQHLSYGEKNAFAMVLFMYQCLSSNPDLIVLDDPISSFDKNKKFAIIEMLFRGKRSLRGKTVLMLTHDLEPIIDMVKNLPHTFNPIPKAAFLRSRSGIVSEIEITKSDVLTFSQVCDENIANNNEDVIKLIYLRRYYETINDKGCEYQLLSNLLHKREEIIDTSGE